MIMAPESIMTIGKHQIHGGDINMEDWGTPSVIGIVAATGSFVFCLGIIWVLEESHAIKIRKNEIKYRSRRRKRRSKKLKDNGV
jgi:hypothetical protein